MIKVTKETHDEFIKQKCLLSFSSPTCPPCKRLAPHLEEVSDVIPVGKVDVSEDIDLAVQYGVTSVPTTFVIDNGEILKRMQGVFTDSEF